jgi:hypothetical protein
MKPLLLLVALLANALRVLCTSDGLTDLVAWDKYSLMVNGSRVFINSAEFHYQRLPVPELWLDVLQKIKAHGFNTISVYFFWSYHSPSKGVYDFKTSGKDVQQLFDYAKQAGLWVTARAGPYCNAETNGGAFALWGSDGSLGNLRTSDPTYHAAWLPWVQQIGQIIAANQITEGGPVILNQIENELQETTHSASNTLVQYMEQVEDAFRSAGVVVPFTSNEKGQRSESWSTDYENVGGAVNVYGLDSYPGGLSCTNINSGFNLVRNYYQWFSNYAFTQPSFLPEFESGWFSAWGSGSFYDDCLAEHDPAFADVYYKNNIGQRITMQNLYMTFGGTNWGYSAAPVVYSSYDYSAPFRETRQIQLKAYQTKLVQLFSTSSPDLLMTEMIGNGTGYMVSSSAIWSWVLRNPDTGATFTTVQQSSSPSRALQTFSVTLNTSAGTVTADNVTLNGRQSKILVTDYTFGSHRLLYATADVLTHGVFGDVDVLAFYLLEGQAGEFAFTGNSSLTFNAKGSSTLVSTNRNGSQVFQWTQGAGSTAVEFSDGSLIYLLDQPTAWKFWAPATTAYPVPGPDERIFVIGPYLVRSANFSNGELALAGDNDNTTTIEAYVGDTAVREVLWNGVSLATSRTSYGSYVATIPGVENRTIILPKLRSWCSADSLPERIPDYDDSHWVVCNKTTTLSPIKPLTLPVLFSSDYGFYTGPKIYRGYFDNDAFISVNITASGGLAFGWSAWVNGHFVGSQAGNASLPTTTAVLPLPAAALNATDNVLTVLVDYHGHDETSTAKGVENPRGLLGASLISNTSNNNASSTSATSTGFKRWRLAGNAGGGAGYLDPVRGPMNEGGLHAERLGWHLPGFPAHSSAGFKCSTCSDSTGPLSGLSGPGVQFSLTNFTLDLDADLDVPLGISLSSPNGTVARVTLWVNGYQYGKYEPHIGPQTVFPVPPGVVNNRGANTLGLSLWAQTDQGARLSSVEIVKYGAYTSSFGFSRDWSALQPGWQDRSQYA